MSDFLNFNTAESHCEIDVDRLQCEAINCLPELLRHLFPNGTFNHNQFVIGNVAGESGNSLKVTLTGKEAGVWQDFATGESGNFFTLWAITHGLSTEKEHFFEVLQSLSTYLNNTPQPKNTTQNNKAPPLDNLGQYTAKWDYHDSDGNLILCQYRYDTDKGKVFRPWDVIAKRHKAPFPRPLFNQPGIKNDDHIIIVEGEKCAQALIAQGMTATTAMNGANAPIDKTDWSPLQGKHLLIWPDNDKAGNDYANAVNQYLSEKAIPASITMLNVPDNKPDKWDAADAVNDGLDIRSFIALHVKQAQAVKPEIPIYDVGDILDDTTPMPEDLISPRILTPGGLLVFGGAPKVGKSDLLLSLLSYMAAGLPFLGLTPPRPLRILYLQAEIGYFYLRERLQNLNFTEEQFTLVRRNLSVTPRCKLLLNEKGITATTDSLNLYFNQKQIDPTNAPIDIITVDPLRNVFDGGDSNGGENDNSAMLFFLQNRLEVLRNAINPDAGIILCHHTRKMPKKQLEEDPFQAFCGASSLRGYYTTGLLMYQPDETQSYRQLIFELRNGSGIANKVIDKVDNVWKEIDCESERLIRRDYGKKLDAERRRKHDAILQLIYNEARLGKVYTMRQFCQVFEDRAELGSKDSIRGRLDILTTNGSVKFFKNADEYDVDKPSRTKFGFLCVEDMQLKVGQDRIDPVTGDDSSTFKTVYPTHFKCKETGTAMPIENPKIWLYDEEEMA